MEGVVFDEEESSSDESEVIQRERERGREREKESKDVYMRVYRMYMYICNFLFFF